MPFNKSTDVLIYLHSSDGKIFETYDSFFKSSALIHYHVTCTTNRNIWMPCIKGEYLRMIIGFVNHYKCTKFLDGDLSAISFENVPITPWDEQFFNLSEKKFRTLLESSMHLNMLSLIVKGIKYGFCCIGNTSGKPIQKYNLDHFDFLPEIHSFSQIALDFESVSKENQFKDHSFSQSALELRSLNVEKLFEDLPSSQTTLNSEDDNENNQRTDYGHMSENQLLSSYEKQISIEIPQEQKMDLDLKNNFATTADIAEAAIMSAVSEAAGSLNINDRTYITRMATGVSMPMDKKYVCSTSDELDEELPTTTHEALQNVALNEVQKWENTVYQKKFITSISKEL